MLDGVAGRRELGVACAPAPTCHHPRRVHLHLPNCALPVPLAPAQQPSESSGLLCGVHAAVVCACRVGGPAPAPKWQPLPYLLATCLPAPQHAPYGLLRRCACGRCGLGCPLQSPEWLRGAARLSRASTSMVELPRPHRPQGLMVQPMDLRQLGHHVPAVHTPLDPTTLAGCRMGVPWACGGWLQALVAGSQEHRRQYRRIAVAGGCGLISRLLGVVLGLTGSSEHGGVATWSGALSGRGVRGGVSYRRRLSPPAVGNFGVWH
jgi:hypothetical protein